MGDPPQTEKERGGGGSLKGEGGTSQEAAGGLKAWKLVSRV